MSRYSNTDTYSQAGDWLAGHGPPQSRGALAAGRRRVSAAARPHEFILADGVA